MFLLDIVKICANIIYFPFKLLKTEKKILFMSRQSNKPSLEFNLLIERLEEDNITTKTLTKKLEFNIKSLCINFFYFFSQMYHIATSKIVIVDGYSIPISILKHKKKLVVIQMWHANGIIKKIGLQTLNKRTKFQKKLALKMNMHQNYSYVISSSDVSSGVFSEAFGVKEENILKFGTPILDYLYYEKYREKENEIKQKYHLGKKVNIVYFPTLRYNNIDMDDFFDNFDFDQYNLILKAHPIQKLQAKNDNCILIKDYSGEEILSIADYVITDYSNIAFEAALIKKPVYFYLFDEKNYKKYPGLNVNLLKELPNNSCTKVKKILNNIYANKTFSKDMDRFVEKHVQTFDGKCIDRIILFLSNKLQE